jgi:caffeoyl-CoA O-methyltransferase
VARRTEQLSDALHEYVIAHSSAPDEILRDLADETLRRLGEDDAGMQIGPEQGQFMTLLAELTGARNAVEVGTFTGYSSICVARGLGAGGKLLCCDVSEEWTSIARRYWERAGLLDRIELRLGPAVATLAALPDGTSFDFAFIDADKASYVDYWDLIVPLVRSGGVIPRPRRRPDRAGPVRAGHQAVQRPRHRRPSGAAGAAPGRRRPHHGPQALSQPSSDSPTPGITISDNPKSDSPRSDTPESDSPRSDSPKSGCSGG